MANLTVYSYIKVYVDDEKNKLSLDDVWRSLRKNFFRVLWASLLTSLLFFFGFIMCFILGIYLYISSCFVIIIMMYEGKSFGKSFKRSFSLAHYQWWSIFLLILVLYFILYIVSLVFNIPVMLIKATYTLNSLSTDSDGTIIKYVLIAITMLSTLAWGFLTCVMYIALSFKYFSIIEKKENPRLLSDISMMEQ